MKAGRLAPSPAALLALLALLLGSCHCERRQEAPGHSTQRAQGAAQERAALRALGVREQMRQLERLTTELRRRALGGASWGAPAQRLARLAEAVDPRSSLPDFEQRARALRARAGALLETTRPDQVGAFNALVDACRACHLRHAGSSAARQLSDRAVPRRIP
ncbi:MAG: hypothetical protein IPL40_06300 [Proteobacteria bacterium]|nr:hypothetical protein [Pseudomonadota bacterium]